MLSCAVETATNSCACASCSVSGLGDAGAVPLLLALQTSSVQVSKLYSCAIPVKITVAGKITDTVVRMLKPINLFFSSHPGLSFR